MGSPRNCPWPDYYLGLQDGPGHRFDFYDLPIDTKGRCIFHSRDMVWKREQQCWSRWLELIERLEEDAGIRHLEFMGFHFVGIPDLRLQEQYRKLGVEKKAVYQILLSGRTIKKRLYLHDCTFYDNVFWLNAKFVEGVECRKVVFKQVTNFRNCQFLDTAYFLADTRFEHNFEVEDCTFDEIADFETSVFQYRFQIANTIFQKQALFEKVYFEGELEVYAHFKAEFNDLTSFEGAGFNCPVHFDSCQFNSEVHFFDTAFRSRLEITEPKINGNIFFTGTRPGVKLFQGVADFDFGLEGFWGSRAIDFLKMSTFST